MYQNYDAALSKTIMFLRFPLIVSVVFIHAGLEGVVIGGNVTVHDGQFPIYESVYHVITNEIARVSVPLFFFISGFLFFYRTDFSMKAYGQKLKKRVRTLLVPYVFWNAAALLAFVTIQIFMPSLTSGNNKPILDYGLPDYLDLFWGHPISYQFWFIRDLMVVVLVSPLVYWLLKFGKGYAVAILGALWISGLQVDIPGFGIVAFFFFSFGAWFSINRHNFAVDFSRFRYTASVVYPILVAASTLLWHLNVDDRQIVHNIGIIAGLVLVVSWSAHGIMTGRLRADAFLADSSFFIFAYHGMPAFFFVKLYVTLLRPASESAMFASYLLIPLVTIGLGIAIYVVLRRYLPAFTAFITGGR